MIHIMLHFIVPAVIVGVFYRGIWKQAYAILIATMLVDLDHLMAVPIYDPLRCSIGFHPLHQLPFIGLYLVMCFVPKFVVIRFIGLGLLIHMILDSIDCQLTNGVWIHLS